VVKLKPVDRTGTFWRITAIARNAFREAVRDRVLYNLVLFVLLLIAAAIFIGELSGGQERKIIVDLGLSAMLLFGVFIAIFVGVGLVYKEIERRTIYAIFSKPVGRDETVVCQIRQHVIETSEQRARRGAAHRR
jgi:ABC-type transport system involved in multi-copper enzyme maturation permease subunit